MKGEANMWLKRKEVVNNWHELAPSSVVVRPKPNFVVVQDRNIDEYGEVANALGFCPAKLLQEHLLQFMSTVGIQIFNYDEVSNYLKKKAQEIDMYWIWRPLREKDKPDGWRWFGITDENRESALGHGGYNDDWEHRRYDKPVPLSILRDVKKIDDKFGDQVGFFVSDYAVPNPDPFIMVTALDVARIVFGVWDEPDFGV
jgi:hypothetical protein